MIAATMGSSALGVLFFFLIALIPVVILRRGRTRKLRREAALPGLSPAVSGTVSSKDGRLHGTYRGHAVEVWASQVDPGPSSGDSSGVFVNVLYLQLGGAAGREAWTCSGWPRLNPFAAAEFKFEFGIGPLFPAFGQIFDVPEHEPRLEERLRAAGLVEVVESLGRESSPFLPDVRYTPAWLPNIPAQLRDTGMRLPARASESP